MFKFRRLLIVPGALLFTILIMLVTYAAWREPASNNRRSHRGQPWPTVPPTPYPDHYYFAAVDPGLAAALMSDQPLAVVAADIPPIGAYLPGSQQLEFATPTPRPRPMTATSTLTQTPSITPSLTFTSTNTLTPTPTITSTNTPTMTPSRTPTASLTVTASLSPTPIPSVTPSRTLSPTPSSTPSSTMTASSTASLTRTSSPTPTQTPSSTSSFTPSLTPSVTPSFTNTAIVDLAQFSGSILVTQAVDECAPRALPVGGVLTQRFHLWHWGIDIGVYEGTPVLATHSGEITFAGWSDEGYGNLIIIESGVFSTYYGHLESLNVVDGQAVQRGMVIGWSGSTGNSSGPHLHYEVRINNIPLDPLTFEQRGYISC